MNLRILNHAAKPIHTNSTVNNSFQFFYYNLILKFIIHESKL